MSADRALIETLTRENASLKLQLAAKTDECEHYKHVSDEAISHLYAQSGAAGSAAVSISRLRDKYDSSDDDDDDDAAANQQDNSTS